MAFGCNPTLDFRDEQIRVPTGRGLRGTVVCLPEGRIVREKGV